MLLNCNSGDKEVIVVPKNYKGYVVITYNQKNGVPAKCEDGKRIYEIPSNGILKTQFKGNYGARQFTEYYYEKIALQNKFPSYVEFDKIPPTTIVGLIGAVGNANKDPEGKETVEYSVYYIGTKDDIKKGVRQAEKIGVTTLAE